MVVAASSVDPPKAVPKEVARLFPDLLLLSLREVRALARPLRDSGALVRPRRRNFSCDFCNCVRARWRWVSLGRGGRGTSTAAAAHVTGCIPVGFGRDPGRAGEGTVFGRRRWRCGRRWLPEEEEMTVGKRFPHPPPPPAAEQLRRAWGGAPERTLLSGCASRWRRRRRFDALISYLPFSLQSVLT